MSAGSREERGALIGEPVGAAAGMTLNGLAWAVLSVPVRWGLGGIFLAAAYFKLRPSPGRFVPSGPQDFFGAVSGFKTGLPTWALHFTTFAVPWVEVICAVALIVGIWTRAAAAVIGGMLLVFTGLVISALLRDLNIKCGCFGDSGLICPGAVGWCKVFENGLMLGAAVAVAMTARHPLSLDDRRACGRG